MTQHVALVRWKKILFIFLSCFALKRQKRNNKTKSVRIFTMDIISFVHKNNNYSIIISIIYVRDDINSDVILHVALICLNRYCLKFICLFFLIFFCFCLYTLVKCFKTHHMPPLARFSVGLQNSFPRGLLYGHCLIF